MPANAQDPNRPSPKRTFLTSSCTGDQIISLVDTKNKNPQQETPTPQPPHEDVYEYPLAPEIRETRVPTRAARPPEKEATPQYKDTVLASWSESGTCSKSHDTSGDRVTGIFTKSGGTQKTRRTRGAHAPVGGGSWSRWGGGGEAIKTGRQANPLAHAGSSDRDRKQNRPRGGALRKGAWGRKRPFRGWKKKGPSHHTQNLSMVRGCKMIDGVFW